MPDHLLDVMELYRLRITDFDHLSTRHRFQNQGHVIKYGELDLTMKADDPDLV